MNQNHSQSGIRNIEDYGIDRDEHTEPLRRIRQQLEDYSRLSEIQKVLSPYWASRSGT